MTAPRFQVQPSKTPTLTGGDDQPFGRCYEDPEPFDELLDPPRGDEARTELVREIDAICGPCPIRDTCHLEQRNEPWMKSLRELRRAIKKPGKNVVAKCGTSGGYYRHTRTLKEEACGPCKKAHAKVQALWKASRNPAMPPKEAALDYGRALHKLNVSAANESRAKDLVALVESGASVEEACRVLDVKRGALQRWCGRHGLKHLYRALRRQPGRENQHTKGAAA